MRNVTSFRAINGILIPATFPLPNIKMNWFPTKTKNKEDHHSSFPMWQYPCRGKEICARYIQSPWPPSPPPPAQFYQMYKSLLLLYRNSEWKVEKKHKLYSVLMNGWQSFFIAEDWNKHTRKIIIPSHNILYSKNL